MFDTQADCVRHCADPGESALSDDDDAANPLFWLAPKAAARPSEFMRCPMTPIAPVRPAVRPDFLNELLRPDAASEAPKQVPSLPASKPQGPWAILQSRLAKVAPKKKRGRPNASRNRTEAELLAEDEMKDMEVAKVC